jgi:nucleotide sugar dehydrogenase
VTEIVPVSSCAEAEMAKLLENTFRHVNIALVNELAQYANGLRVNIWRVIDAASTKPFGFMRFEPGPGVGGHCLPIDPSFLSWRVEDALGRPFRFVDLANEINRGMPELVVERVSRLLNLEEKSLRGSKILLLGYSYKAGTGDLRESPSEKVGNLLCSYGVTLSICDPYVDPRRTGPFEHTFVPFSSDTLSGQDVVVVLVGHPEFDPMVIARSSPLVLDTRNFLRGTVFRGEVL